jgi:tricorn protease
MRFIFSILLLAVFSISFLFAESHLMRYADVSDNHIVFTYEGDLWLAPIGGGKAKRITRSDGSESFAKFSPDGSKLAFTGNYDGGSDVYIMNIGGGEPMRLTYHSAQDLVLDWFPDGKSILFRSRREYPYRADMIYKISIDGGMSEKLPVDRAGLASLSPDGKSVAYNRVSREFRTWKRHKGGTAQDVWVGSFDKGDFQRVTTYDGTDNFPMWYKNAVYFTSDRADGTLNIFKYDLNTKDITQLTFYKDYDIKYPSLGGTHIVYQYQETIYLFDLENEGQEPALVNIEIPSDGTLTREGYIDAAKFTGAFGLSPKGKRAIFDIRGEIVNIPVDEGVIYNLTNSSASREKNSAWSPDGKTVVFISDKSGEEELYLTDPKGSGEWKQLTKGGKGFRMQPVWSPDSKYLIFHDKYMQLNLVDAKSGKVTKVDQSDYDDAWYRWGIQDYSWSPDSKWIVYSKLEQSMYESIFIYSLAQNKKYRVTSEMTPDWSPSFSKDGKYLYYLSNRTYEPVMGAVDQNHIFLDMARPYILILKEGDPSPFIPKNVFDDTEEAEDDSRSENVIITLSNFDKRTVAAGVSAGNLFRLEAIECGFIYLKKTEKEFLKYQFVDDQNSAVNLDLYKFDLEEAEDELLMSGVSQYHLSADGEKLIYKAGGKFGVVDADGKAKAGDGKLDLAKVHIKIDKKQEFLQIYNEAWRVQRDWFYDKNMHGLNWEKTGEKYRKFIPYCGRRQDVNYLIGELIAELNTGHTYIGGGDYERSARIPTALLGAEFSCKNSKSYPKIERIIPTDNWDDHIRSPFYEPGCPIKEGDYILAIDGVKIKPGDNIYKYLENKAGQVIEITYNSKADFKTAKKYLTKTIRSEYQLRYNEWKKNNTQYVDKAANNQVGYIHIPGMMENGLIEFAKAFYPQYYKNGLIIDARYNGGGFTSKQIHDRLERTLNAIVQPREGKRSNIPERAFYGHLVLLINRDTGSDGELFAEAWKFRKMGPVIGQRTWGGAVGIETHQKLLDGATTTPPQFGEYGMDGKWIIEGHGVDPDIEIVNMPGDVLKGKDTQLDKAIEVILNNIKNKPMRLPERPAYEDKSKPSLK